MATYSWALIRDGQPVADGTEFHSGFETPEEYGRFQAARPRPFPVDEVHVWAGDVPAGEPVRVRRHPRRRALAGAVS
ncbi:hypothetical protein FHR83_006761 [Actinoplanes campanulatus]|uniref:Uncharacterized protein n=1 Tax=Actinoplanes campanulatus TaxID=113559 RepID=A0A7W5FI33_9ACTN|nr:hypothetical protein [Actinoplanes campanulatus]MBB3099055.1 hypothetical protein [Actinoplanes campanulatus]GGN39238.1 hypothetical protein GCM10010109_66960 [Actinoplanes campanulatus]GID40213.1 hypothetical protein Aca09nite_67190 [Actinoplanes campanulatus]